MGKYKISHTAFEWAVNEEGKAYGDPVAGADYDFIFKKDMYAAWKMLQGLVFNVFYEVVNHKDGTKTVEMWTQDVKKVMADKEFPDISFDGYFLHLGKRDKVEAWMTQGLSFS